MDKLKKKRASLRTAFTKAWNSFNQAHQSEEISDLQLTVYFKLLEQKMKILDTIGESIIELLLEDTSGAEVITEYEEAEEYKAKFLLAESIMEEISAKRRNSVTPTLAISAETTTELKKRYTLPRIELYKFSGDVREWLQFWSLFKKIHEDQNISKEDKFQYLIQAMIPGSRAAELVKSYPPTGENYDKVISSLENRFGNEQVQIEVHVRELIQIVWQKRSADDKTMSLSTLYDKLESHMRALESLGVTRDKFAAMLFPLVESCLPEEKLRAWQRSSSVQNTVERMISSVPGARIQSEDRLTQLIRFLEEEVRGELRVSMAAKGFSEKSAAPAVSEKIRRSKVDFKDIPSVTDLFVSQGKQHTCIFCNKHNHESANCSRAMKMDPSERLEILKKNSVCFQCLKPGHTYRTCRVRVRCGHCSRQHVTMMCRGAVKKVIPLQVAQKEEESTKGDCILASICSDPQVYLQTLKIKLNHGNKAKVVRAIIDTGSQKSYITRETALSMNYQPIAEQRMTHALFGGQHTEIINHKKYLVQAASIDNVYKCSFVALDQEIICNGIPSLKKGPWCEDLKNLNINVSDLDNKNSTISVLIGANIAGKLLTGQRKVLSGGLVAIETLLGWTVMGSIPEQQSSSRQDPVISTMSMLTRSEDISNLWALDLLGIRDPIEQKQRKEREDEEKRSLLESLGKNLEGRYEAALPWVENHPPLSSNIHIAERRLHSTVKKLKADGYFEEYGTIFQEWLSEGIIESVPDEEKDNWGHYLPHRHVIKESSTTKIRPVFDASAKDQQHPSLNECLQKGPNLIELISSILLRFREGKLGVVSDVRKAFLQISIRKEDRDFLRFFWLDKDGNMIVLRHCRLVFGLSCSPFILGATINLHLQQIISSLENKFNVNNKVRLENIQKLSKSFYVDNCVASVESSNQLKEFISYAKTSMEAAAFDLRGWEYTGDNSCQNQTAVLGIKWNKQADTLSINLSEIINNEYRVITKRVILSVAHRLFDPLGIVCPVALVPRLILQETWAQKLSWDEEINDEIKTKFYKWLNELESMREIEIPRCFLGDVKEYDHVSIHTFCDASKLAYAAVVFIRVVYGNQVKVHFVQAKTRVAPIKGAACDPHLSIPRLELLAAITGVRLTNTILNALTFKFDPANIVYWTDSSTVLAWIQRANNWGTFVWNRVKEIRELSDPNQWKHVPGHDNPADLPSRGCTVSHLLSSKWWEGPTFLWSTTEVFDSDAHYDEEEIERESRKTPIKTKADTASLLATINQAGNTWKLFNYSDFRKIVRVLSWVLRFYANTKKPLESRVTGELSAVELQNAENLIIKIIQSDNFVNSENDIRIKHLQPFKDSNGLIRLNSKIILRVDTFNFRCPVILPNKNELVNLIIKEKHLSLNHAGVEITMSALREDFWILGGRKAIRTVIRNCTVCRRHDAKPIESAPLELPLNRVREAAVFEIVGVDFTGPIYLKGNGKAWICLFTCAIFRAVHLELVTSLSTASFLMALRRLIARRGKPSVIYSDNGTNFVGLNNSLKHVDFKRLASVAANKQIEWKFNPPTAAWWGGFWERLNGVLKRLLRRTLRRCCLNYEEMLTVLLDCEAVINSRPITFMSENEHEVVPLTPSMFLQEIKEIGVIDLDQVESQQLNKKYMYRQKIKNDLRKRFRSEYLGTLVHRKSSVKNMRNVCVGDIVLIEQENAKRVDWPLARVIRVIVGKDNNVRVVHLLTAAGEMVRPVQRIYPLEIRGDIFSAPIEEIIIDKYTDNSKCINANKSNEENVQNSHNDKCVITRSGRKSIPPNRLQYC